MQEIDRLARADYRRKEIAAMLGIPQSTVTRLLAKYRGFKPKKQGDKNGERNNVQR